VGLDGAGVKGCRGEIQTRCYSTRVFNVSRASSLPYFHDGAIARYVS